MNVHALAIACLMYVRMGMSLRALAASVKVHRTTLTRGMKASTPPISFHYFFSRLHLTPLAQSFFKRVGPALYKLYRAPLNHAMLPIIHFVVGRQVLMFDSTYWYLDGRPITEVTGKFMYSDHTGRVQVNMLSGTFPRPFLYAIGMPSSGSANEDDTLIKFIEERPDLQQMIRDGKLVLMFDRGFSRTARARDYLRKLRALVLRPVMAKNVRLRRLFFPLFFLTH
jgi:hypothetical protein